jgi:hypothetical protein
MACYNAMAEEAEEKAKKRRHMLTRGLCTVLTRLEELDFNFALLDLDKELLEWWDEHKAWDKERKNLEI